MGEKLDNPTTVLHPLLPYQGVRNKLTCVCWGCGRDISPGRGRRQRQGYVHDECYPATMNFAKGTSNLRAVKCRLCGTMVPKGIGVKVWYDLTDHKRKDFFGNPAWKRPKIGYVHRREVGYSRIQFSKFRPFQLPPFKVKPYFPGDNWEWQPLPVKRGRPPKSSYVN